MVCFLLEETKENGYVFTVCDYKESFGDTISNRWLSIISNLDKNYIEFTYDNLYFYFTIGAEGAFDVYYLDENDNPCTKCEIVELADSIVKDLANITGNNIPFYDIKLKLITIYMKYIDQLLQLDLN
jgi:hypothetical protein